VEAQGRIKCGDRVAGLADGMEGLRPQSGAFAEYVSVDGGMCFKMPEGMTFAEGASMPLRIVTACMALFGSLEVPSELLQSPTTKDKLTVLVYGGATSTGTAAIQLLSRCGVTVVTTCSTGSMTMVEGYGADKCFDYNEATCGDDIRSYTGNALDYALDCITSESSVKICYRALGRCGGKCK
jgi:NADPH:quinone reductase-like Zn-dependent oxidoreductase